MAKTKATQVETDEVTSPLQMRTLITNNFDVFQAFGVKTISYSFAKNMWTISYGTGRKKSSYYYGRQTDEIKRITKPTLSECIAEFNLRLQAFALQRQKDLQEEAKKAREKAIKAQEEARRLDELSRTLEEQAKSPVIVSDVIAIQPETSTPFEDL